MTPEHKERFLDFNDGSITHLEFLDFLNSLEGFEIGENREVLEDSLIVATQERSSEIALKLTELGAKGDLFDEEDLTALHYAAENDLSEVVRKIIEGGVSSNINHDDSKLTPLHLAAAKASEDSIRALKDKGANLNSQDKNGYTASHYAAENTHEDIIKLLADLGANTNIGNKNGKTADEMLAERLEEEMGETGMEGVEAPAREHEEPEPQYTEGGVAAPTDIAPLTSNEAHAFAALGAYRHPAFAPWFGVYPVAAGVGVVTGTPGPMAPHFAHPPIAPELGARQAEPIAPDLVVIGGGGGGGGFGAGSPPGGGPEEGMEF